MRVNFKVLIKKILYAKNRFTIELHICFKRIKINKTYFIEYLTHASIDQKYHFFTYIADMSKPRILHC